jgi:hypothetical protein
MLTDPLRMAGVAAVAVAVGVSSPVARSDRWLLLYKSSALEISCDTKQK